MLKDLKRYTAEEFLADADGASVTKTVHVSQPSGPPLSVSSH